MKAEIRVRIVEFSGHEPIGANSVAPESIAVDRFRSSAGRRRSGEARWFWRVLVRCWQAYRIGT
jgi:hypothetical protein